MEPEFTPAILPNQPPHSTKIRLIVVLFFIVGVIGVIGWYWQMGQNSSIIEDVNTIVGCEKKFKQNFFGDDLLVHELYNCYSNVAKESLDYSICDKIDDHNPLVVRRTFGSITAEEFNFFCLASVTKAGGQQLNVADCSSATLSPRESGHCSARAAVVALDDSQCGTIELPRYQDMCYETIAQATSNLALCDRVSGDQTKTSCVIGIAAGSGDPAICRNKLDGYDRASCLSIVAAGIQEPTLCSEISIEGDDYSSQRSVGSCYEGIALSTKDPRWCDKAYFKESCLREIKSLDEQNLLFDLTLDDCLNSRKIDEERDPDPEICYAQLSILNNDEALCDQIEDEYTSQSCYEELAFNNLNTRYCEKLPRDLNHYQEKCKLTVATLGGDEGICESLDNQSFGNDFKDLCYSDVAEYQRDPKYCPLISKSDIRERCYAGVAEERVDLSLMNNVVDKETRDFTLERISNLFYNGQPLNIPPSEGPLTSSSPGIKTEPLATDYHYRNSKYGFELTLPKGWILSRDETLSHNDGTPDWDGKYASLDTFPELGTDGSLARLMGPEVVFWSSYDKDKVELYTYGTFIKGGGQCLEGEMQSFKNSDPRWVTNLGSVNGYKYYKASRESEHGSEGFAAVQINPTFVYEFLSNAEFIRSKQFEDILATFKWWRDPKEFDGPEIISIGKVQLIEVDVSSVAKDIKSFFIPDCFKFSTTAAKTKDDLSDYFIIHGPFHGEIITIETRSAGDRLEQSGDQYIRGVLKDKYVGIVGLKNGSWQKAVNGDDTVYETLSGQERVTVRHQGNTEQILNGGEIDHFVANIVLAVPGKAEPR